uniref:Uncharacterized protein K02A2.6-like n=1 Tax=Saccoglossus kowalevskii TaxID=10224 RepID=A0ABM0MLQ1_SACKO|nr:PREDICTED: uncharacterized protein K02A2.6-like [Saccoglossus kowalevskii]
MDTLRNMTSRTVISKIKRHFTVHGIPHTIISDNAGQFASIEFKQFSKEWNFNHITSNPEYPQSNGLAERAVQSAKKLLEKTEREGSDLYLNLLNLRNVPSDNTLGSPAQRLMSRRTRTSVPISKPLLNPHIKNSRKISSQLSKKRGQKKKHFDKSAKALTPLKPNQTVRLQTPNGYNRLGLVKHISNNPRSYIGEVGNT